MTTSLEAAIDAGKALGKTALYWGCWERSGHYMHRLGGKTVWDTQREFPGFSWSDDLLDGGLLKNGKHEDVYDGKVFWTCGGKSFWYAFFWWDNSVDPRGASNSGLYVRGFGWPEPREAFEYACAEFPSVIARQKHTLVLQDPFSGNQRLIVKYSSNGSCLLVPVYDHMAFGAISATDTENEF